MTSYNHSPNFTNIIIGGPACFVNPKPLHPPNPPSSSALPPGSFQPHSDYPIPHSPDIHSHLQAFYGQYESGQQSQPLPHLPLQHPPPPPPENDPPDPQRQQYLSHSHSHPHPHTPPHTPSHHPLALYQSTPPQMMTSSQHTPTPRFTTTTSSPPSSQTLSQNGRQKAYTKRFATIGQDLVEQLEYYNNHVPYFDQGAPVVLVHKPPSPRWSTICAELGTHEEEVSANAEGGPSPANLRPSLGHTHHNTSPQQPADTNQSHTQTQALAPISTLPSSNETARARVRLTAPSSSSHLLPLPLSPSPSPSSQPLVINGASSTALLPSSSPPLPSPGLLETTAISTTILPTTALEAEAETNEPRIRTHAYAKGTGGDDADADEVAGGGEMVGSKALTTASPFTIPHILRLPVPIALPSPSKTATVSGNGLASCSSPWPLHGQEAQSQSLVPSFTTAYSRNSRMPFGSGSENRKASFVPPDESQGIGIGVPISNLAQLPKIHSDRTRGRGTATQDPPTIENWGFSKRAILPGEIVVEEVFEYEEEGGAAGVGEGKGKGNGEGKAGGKGDEGGKGEREGKGKGNGEGGKGDEGEVGKGQGEIGSPCQRSSHESNYAQEVLADQTHFPSSPPPSHRIHTSAISISSSPTPTPTPTPEPEPDRLDPPPLSNDPITRAAQLDAAQEFRRRKRREEGCSGGDRLWRIPGAPPILGDERYIYYNRVGPRLGGGGSGVYSRDREASRMMEEWKEVRGGVGRGEKKENKKEEDEGMVEKGKQKAIVDEEVEKNSFEEQLTPRPQHRQQQQSHSEHQEHSHSKQHYLRQGGPDSDKPEEWYIDQQQPHQVQGQQEQEPQPQPEDERREDILAKTTESDDTCDRLSGMGNEDSTEASPDPRAEHAFSMPTPEPESWYTNQQQQEQREEKQGSCSCCRLGVGSVGSVLGCCPCCCWVPSTPTLELETDSRDQQLEQEQTQEQQFEEELADLQQQEHVSLTPISESEVYYTDQQQQEQKQEQQLEDHPVESSPDQQEPTTPTPIPTESPPDQQIEPFIPTPTQDAHNLHDLEEPPAIPLHRPSYYSRITQDPSHLPPSERRYWLLLSPPQRQHTRALIEAGEETSYQHTWEECNKLVEAQREGKDVDFCY